MDYIHPILQSALSKVRPIQAFLMAFFMALYKGATHHKTKAALHWVYQKTLGEGGLSEKLHSFIQTYGPKAVRKTALFIQKCIHTIKG